MSSRSLNKVQLIGNLTRDPELRYTPQGTAVCTIGMATNRSWTTDAGDKREETEFHRLVAWNKLAELCAQLLTKGRKIFIEGRLQTRSWTAQDGTLRTTTEIVIDDMILLDSRKPGIMVAPGGTQGPVNTGNVPLTAPTAAPVGPVTAKPAPSVAPTDDTAKKKKKKAEEAEEKKEENADTEKAAPNGANTVKEDLSADDIPF